MKRILAVVGVILLACDIATEPIERVEVTLTVAPTEVEAGDSIHFTAEAFNPTDERIPFSYGCAPAMDIHVRTPDGDRISVLMEITAGGAFTCEGGPHSFLEPGETQPLRLDWEAPDRAGTYRAVAGIRTDEGLTNSTASEHFVVR